MTAKGENTVERARLPSGRAVKVYLLRIEGERCLFYSESVEASNAAAGQSEGVRGWIESRYRSLQNALSAAESGIGLHMRRAWRWLHKRTPLDEALLRSLRAASSIELFYPSITAEETARAQWVDYLARRWRRHVFWFIGNLLIVPATVLLTPVPGPNIIGYWFAYRAICHLLALLGVRHARSAPTRFHAAAALDTAFAGASDQAVARATESLGLPGLPEFIRRAVEHGARDITFAES